MNSPRKSTAPSTAARRTHYADFYGPAREPGEPGVPHLVVVGNCQAESLRLLLDPSRTRSVRVPPVFELTAEDLPHLTALLARTDVLVTQPVHDDYRDLPLGTSQLAALLPGSARVVVVPTLRFAGLHPYHVLHHPPGDVPEPPVVPYHDLRTVRAVLHPEMAPPPQLTPEAVRAVATASVAELRRREAHTDVGVSDLLLRPQADDVRTVNHPGNRLLLALAERTAAVAGLPAPVDPGRRLLDGVLAPVDPVVVRAWQLGDDAVRRAWRIEGREVAVEEVDRRHHAWYAAHPPVTETIWERFAPVARDLGLVL